MRNKTICMLLAPIFFAGCVLGTPTPTPAPTATPAPPLSDTSRRLYEKLVEEGTLLDQMTENGVNFRDFSNQFAKYDAAHTMIFEVANRELKRDLILEMDLVIAGWGSAQNLWDAKINDLDPPTEPDINGFVWIKRYVPEELLRYKRHTSSVYENKQYIDFDVAISGVLSTASGHFKKVRTELLKVLQEQGE